MARYIDAEELELEYYGLSIHGTMAVKSVLPIFTDLLEKQPTADVEEVEWIDVNKRLPDEDGRYLVYRKFGFGNYKNIEVIRFENDSSYYKYVWNREITHWQPLPEAPRMVGDSE